MSGILDSKSRVIDTIITTEGRRQLAAGGINIQYVTFTDNTAFYRADISSGSQDATKRLYLEACQLPQDQITFRADDTGNLESFSNSEGVNIASGKILTYSFAPLTGSMVPAASQTTVSLSGDAFALQAEKLLSSATDNFRKMYIIATQDTVFDDDQFAMGPNNVTYVINNEHPLSNVNMHTTHITARDSIHTDPRLSDKLNFRFMPPVNKLSDRSLDKSDFRVLSKFNVGLFHPLGRSHLLPLKHPQIMHELRYYQDQGYSHVVNFDPTSNDNQLIGQFFERSGDVLKKLDIIDHGRHNTGDPKSPVAHIFFVGNVVVDEKGTDTFIHLFTLVFG